MVLARTREILEETSVDLADSICVYRGGYVAEDRRKIEADLFGGKLRGVAATNALEFGIDAGHIDATLHLGFPGSIASFWQQAGRSGRRSKQSIAVYVGFEGALDQYFMNFPQKLFGKPVEHCQVDSQNQKVLGQHLACAAFEKPLCPEHDERYFGSGMNSLMVTLNDRGCLMNNQSGDSGVWKYAGPDKSPSRTVSIRAIEHDRYKVIDKQGYRVLEEIEESKAFFQVYEGAVYMHQGCSYLVERLDHSSRTAYCSVADLNYYTRIRDHTEISVLEGDVALPPRSASSKTDMVRTTAQANNCKVMTEWVCFDRIWKSNNLFSDNIKLHLPPYSFDTQAAWVSVPKSVRAAIEQRKLGFQGGVHAASHALLSIVPLHMMCSTSDLGTQCAGPQQTSKTPDRILLYDKHPGGIGLASQVKLLFGELLVAALQLISACGCTNLDGCPIASSHLHVPDTTRIWIRRRQF
jgi:DEAD/DEAH box helicase domain-containing protein